MKYQGAERKERQVFTTLELPMWGIDS